MYWTATLRRAMIALVSGFIFHLVLWGTAHAQFPKPALVGYLHNWNTVSAPYVPLTAVDTAYNVINVAFAIPEYPTDYRMTFVPDGVSQSTFLGQVRSVQRQGRIVNISIGGATAPVTLHTTVERDSFIVSMLSILDTYGFDGIDIDLEGSSLSVSGGTIATPVDAPVIHLIDAIRTIMREYHREHGKRMYLSMAPETAFVQGGQSTFRGVWGAYLPVIEALRDSIEILHVQLYNSGTMYGIDRKIYTQGTADFIIAMAEAAIRGFQTTGGQFTGLPESKIAVGLPACSRAAGGGYTSPETVMAAMRYLLGSGPQPAAYTLAQADGYPSLRGMMTWSVNWDASTSCSSQYEFARTYQSIYQPKATQLALVPRTTDPISIHPNPVRTGKTVIVSTTRHIRSVAIHDALGREWSRTEYAGSTSPVQLPAPAKRGMYLLLLTLTDGSTRIERVLVLPDG